MISAFILLITTKTDKMVDMQQLYFAGADDVTIRLCDKEFFLANPLRKTVDKHALALASK